MTANVQIFINDKEMVYSRQNMIAAVNSFLPYMTNDDLKTLEKDLHTLIDHRRQKDYLAHITKKKDEAHER